MTNYETIGMYMLLSNKIFINKSTILKLRCSFVVAIEMLHFSKLFFLAKKGLFSAKK